MSCEEPQWMTDRVRQLEADGVLIKRSPLDPPPPPVRIEDFGPGDPPNDECSNGGGYHLWVDTGGGVAVCEFCGDEIPW